MLRIQSKGTPIKAQASFKQRYIFIRCVRIFSCHALREPLRGNRFPLDWILIIDRKIWRSGYRSVANFVDCNVDRQNQNSETCHNQRKFALTALGELVR
jgi:hypothetical protein